MTLTSPDAIKAAVQQALAHDPSIPPGHRAALVTVVNTDKAEVVLATRLADGWSAQIIASHEWTGDTQAGVTIKGTW